MPVVYKYEGSEAVYIIHLLFAIMLMWSVVVTCLIVATSAEELINKLSDEQLDLLLSNLQEKCLIQPENDRNNIDNTVGRIQKRNIDPHITFLYGLLVKRVVRLRKSLYMCKKLLRDNDCVSYPASSTDFMSTDVMTTTEAATTTTTAASTTTTAASTTTTAASTTTTAASTTTTAASTTTTAEGSDDGEIAQQSNEILLPYLH